jgi:hypothetical protein
LPSKLHPSDLAHFLYCFYLEHESAPFQKNKNALKKVFLLIVLLKRYFKKKAKSIVQGMIFRGPKDYFRDCLEVGWVFTIPLGGPQGVLISRLSNKGGPLNPDSDRFFTIKPGKIHYPTKGNFISRHQSQIKTPGPDLWLDFHQVQGNGKLDKLAQILDLQFFHDIGAMGLYRTLADKKNIGDFLRGTPLGDHLEHFPFTV